MRSRSSSAEVGSYWHDSHCCWEVVLVMATPKLATLHLTLGLCAAEGVAGRNRGLMAAVLCWAC